jgi:hypothetical protein
VLLPTFRKYKLPPSSESEQGATSAHSLITPISVRCQEPRREYYILGVNLTSSRSHPNGCKCLSIYLGLLRVFIIVFFRGGSLAPRPTPNLEDQGLHFVWPLPFGLYGIGGATKSLHSRQHSFLGHWRVPPLHDKAVTPRSICLSISSVSVQLPTLCENRNKPLGSTGRSKSRAHQTKSCYKLYCSLYNLYLLPLDGTVGVLTTIFFPQ